MVGKLRIFKLCGTAKQTNKQQTPLPLKKNHTHTNKRKGSNNFCPLCFFHFTKESLRVINTWTSLVHFPHPTHHINVGFDWWTYAGVMVGLTFHSKSAKVFLQCAFRSKHRSFRKPSKSEHALEVWCFSTFSIVLLLPHMKFKTNTLFYLWLHWVFVAVGGLSLVAAGERGLPFYKCTGFSFFRTQALEHRLSSCGAGA